MTIKSIVFKTAAIIIVLQSIILLIGGQFMLKNQLEIMNNLSQSQEKYVLSLIEKQKQKDLLQEKDTINALVGSIKGAIYKALFNVDIDTAKETIKKFLERETIEGVYIVDSTTNSVFLSAYKDKNHIKFANLPENIKKLPFIETTFFYDNSKLGVMKVYYNLKHVIDKIEKDKQKNIQIIEKKFQETKNIIKHTTHKQNIYLFIGGLFLTFIIVLILYIYVNKPLKEIKEGLGRFFNFLSNPKIPIKPIKIDREDEFGEIAKFANEGIKVSAQLHREITNLLEIVDEHVLIIEMNLDGNIINVSSAFLKRTNYSKNDLIHKNINSVINNDINIKFIEKNIEKNSLYIDEWKFPLKNKEILYTYTIISKKCEVNGGHCGYFAINYDITDKKRFEELNKSLEQKVEERTRELQQMHKHIQESIKFASLLQNALLPEKAEIDKYFKDNFILWEPKDIVGGDIYLFDELRNENECVLMVIDCTGHGVPGAFVTMTVKAIEREIVAKIKEDKTMEVSPAWILSYFNKTIKKLLKQDSESSLNNAGFDGGIVYYNKREQILRFAGAQVPLFYIEDDEVKIIKGDRYSVGYKNCDIDHKYKEITLNVKEGMKFYITTDGYLDQNGGKKGFPFGKKRFIKVIQENKELKMSKQLEIFKSVLLEYQGKEDRNDDITVVGFEIGKKSEIEIILEYNGVLSQSMISYNLDIIENSIKDKNIIWKLSSILIEIIQNMISYSKEINPIGYIKLIKYKQEYIIETKQIIHSKDKINIQKELENISLLDKKEIKRKYKELLRDNSFKGIQFYGIAKLAQIEYSFDKIDEEKYNFKLKIKLKRNIK